MMRHLDTARLELRRALEEHEAACEVDAVTRMILESYVAILAARRELVSWRDRGLPSQGDHRRRRSEVLSLTGGNSAKDRATTMRHLEIVP